MVLKTHVKLTLPDRMHGNTVVQKVDKILMEGPAVAEQVNGRLRMVPLLHEKVTEVYVRSRGHTES